MIFRKRYPKWIKTQEDRQRYDNVIEQEKLTKALRRLRIAQPQNVRVLTITGRLADGSKQTTEYRIVPERPEETIKVRREVMRRNKRRHEILKIPDAHGNFIHFVRYDDQPGFIYIFIVKSHMILDRFTIELLRNALNRILDEQFPGSPDFASQNQQPSTEKPVQKSGENILQK